MHHIKWRNVGEVDLFSMLVVLNGIVSVLDLIMCSKLDEKNNLWEFP